MTKMLDEAVESVRGLPINRQDEMASMLMINAKLPLISLTPQEKTDLVEADAKVARGDFASDEEMTKLWAKYGA